ncbi:CvpA family protein [Desmospora activa]|uniref:Putative membrane protein required for colicin V production n=1 Tax=Desmospora activa DSM 45169 TaxID=1121389 RepID=A0A2T4Z8C8_9BACL|nr:CvpA family protein [Desmospora activa]PTM58153.1 putative membrane protein required for colicin V production [Desmospora activa DSM 45169]
MNWMDFIIVLLLVGALIQGYRKGLIKEAFSLLGVIVALYLAWKFSGALAESLAGIIPLPDSFSEGLLGLLPIEQALYTLLAFFLIFVIVRILLRFLSAALAQLVKIPVLAQVNGVGGAALGFLKAFLIILVTVNLLALLPWKSGQEVVAGSGLSQGMLELTPDWQLQKGETDNAK